MANQDEDDYGMMQRMKLWDKKLYHLDDEMLIYIMQRADTLLEYRNNKLEENII